MPASVAGLFKSRPEAEGALRKLEESGFPEDQVVLATPRIGRKGHYGRKVVAGIAVGTLVGVVLGAFATGLVPGTSQMIPGAAAVIFLLAAGAGAITGGLGGALVAMAASGDRALYYEQEVQSGRFLISVTGPRLGEARAILLAAGAMEAEPVESPLEGGRPHADAG